MGRTWINVSAVIDATSQINSAKTSVSSAKSAFTQTKNSVDSKIQSRSNIRSRLGTVQNQLSNIDSQIERIRTVVQSSANLYKNTDDRVESWSRDISDSIHISTPAQTSGNWASYFEAIGSILEPLQSCDAVQLVQQTVSSIKQSISDMREKWEAYIAELPPVVDMEEYNDKVSDAEYAKLCQLWYNALDNEHKTPKTAFLELIQEKLPENDPLRNVLPEQIETVNLYSGFDAVIIHDGDVALVIFAGTDPSSVGDLFADAGIVLGQFSPQEVEALRLIDELSDVCSEIVVTGHSLGGYLATAVTLRNDDVSKCVTFDPPGRYDNIVQNVFNHDSVEKITTYEANGSPISDGLDWLTLGNNQNVGEIINIDVQSENNAFNHGIKYICEALGGDEKIANTWR